MKNFTIIALTTILLSCENQPNIELDELYGVWTENSESIGFDPERTRTLTFEPNGNFKSEIRLLNDSVLTSISGTFEIDTIQMLLSFTNEGWVLKDMKLHELTGTSMTAEISEELEGSGTVKYSKK